MLRFGGERRRRFSADMDAAGLLRWMRKFGADLRPSGPAAEITVWRELGPNASPTFSKLVLDELLTPLTTSALDLDIPHGSVLLV